MWVNNRFASKSHTVLDCRVGVLFQSFCAVITNTAPEKTGERAWLWAWLWAWLPFIFLYLACPVMGKCLRCLSPGPGTSGSSVPVPTSLTRPPSPTPSQAKLTSGNDLSDVIYSLRGNLPPLQKSLNFVCFHYHEMAALYPVKTEVSPVRVGKLGGKSYLVPFLDP